jgi:hypothetical protein
MAELLMIYGAGQGLHFRPLRAGFAGAKGDKGGTFAAAMCLINSRLQERSRLTDASRISEARSRQGIAGEPDATANRDYRILG